MRGQAGTKFTVMRLRLGTVFNLPSAFLVAALALPLPGSATTDETPLGPVIDRVVAEVEQRVMTLSEVETVARLEVARRKGQAAITEALPLDYLEDVRQHLISDYLLVSEASRFGTPPPTATEVAPVVAALKERFATSAQYQNFLRVLAVNESEVFDYLRRSLWVNHFVENKLKGRIEVSSADRAKYRTEHPDAATWSDKQVNSEVMKEQLVARTRQYILELCERAEVRVLSRFDPDPSRHVNPCSGK